MRSLRSILPVIAACLLWAGCSNTDCTDYRSSQPTAGFYSSVTGEAAPLDSVLIFGVGAPGDSLLVDWRKQVSEALLPFRIDAHTTRFVLQYTDRAPRLRDTVEFTYTPEPFFVSDACGAIYKFRIENIRHTSVRIDSIVCPAGVIDNVPGVNLKFYLN